MNTLIDSKTLLFRLINTSLKVNIDETTFDMSLPIANNSKQNTLVQLTPLTNSGFYGVFDFKYNRLNINDIERIEISKGTATLYSEVMDQVIYNGGLSITVQDNFTTEVYENKLSIIDFNDSLLPVLGSKSFVDTLLSTSYMSYIFSGELKVRIIP